MLKAITGQNFLAYHQSKIDIEVSKFCRLCEEESETFIHMITDCPKLFQLRTDVFIGKEVGGNHEWSIRRVMEFINTPTISRMLTSKTDLPLKDVLYLDQAYSDSDSDL